MDAEVLIVGAGPVGLTLALDLGLRGIRTLLVDTKRELLRLPKMERSNPRTMEIYRRLGMIDQIRAAGYPAGIPMDVLIVSSLAERPLLHQHYPSVEAARATIAACDDGTLPREPYQLISQYTLEPLLLARVQSLSSITLRMGTELIGFRQDQERVEAEIRNLDSGMVGTATAKYLVGCDGASSGVRKQLGIKMEGRARLGSVTNVFFRCDELFEKAGVPPGRHYCFAGIDSAGGAAGVIVVQDDRRHFAYHTQMSPDGDLAAELRRVTGLDIRPEILHAGRWEQHMLVAERHGEGRVLLAGDANHIFIPAGGLGMNTGIGDAVNLAWKLAGTLHGWGGPGLVESYHVERSVVARRNLAAVDYALAGVAAWRGMRLQPEIRDDNAAGEALRQSFAEAALPLNRRVYEMHGTELGYRYASSVICEEAGDPPPDDSYAYQPSTWPGSHLPHVWLAPGLAIYDRLGAGFTLLRLGGTPVDMTALETAFADQGAPLDVLEIGDPRIRKVYERDLILVRPDLHVVWRGDAAPADPRSVAIKAVGKAG